MESKILSSSPPKKKEKKNPTLQLIPILHGVELYKFIPIQKVWQYDVWTIKNVGYSRILRVDMGSNMVWK